MDLRGIQARARSGAVDLARRIISTARSAMFDCPVDLGPCRSSYW